MTDERSDDCTTLISLYTMRQHWIDCLQATLGEPDARLAQAHAEAKLGMIEERIKELTAKGRGEQTG